ncbi:MAG: hypothetical protein ABIQ97_06740 [Lysobacteraceae bacterium]
MNTRFLLSGLVMTIATALLGYVIHGVLLAADYTALGAMMRTPEDSAHYMQWMLLADAAIGFGLTWIYRQGWTPGKSAISQGLMCGFAVALVSVIPMFLFYYAVQPTPSTLAHKQLLFSLAEMLLLGVLVSLLNPAPRSS